MSRFRFTAFSFFCAVVGCTPTAGTRGRIARPDPTARYPREISDINRISTVPSSKTRGDTGRAPSPPGEGSAARIPGGLACLIRLRELGVPHRSAGAMADVNTPVQVDGPIHGVSLVPTGRRTARGDCRLMLALHRAAPLLRSLGVDQLFFSNIHRRGRLPSGRLSRHAMGLAIDVHRLRVNGKILRVKRDYSRGLTDPCAASSPPLNRVACLLKRGGYFDRVLTPDTDRAHHNHFHLAILSLHRRRFVPEATPPPPDTE